MPPCPPQQLQKLLLSSGRLSFLDSQMMWVVCNVPEFNYAEMFAARLVTPAPLLEGLNQELLVDVPANLEDWILAQESDSTFPAFYASLSDAAIRNGLHVLAPDNKAPRILVPENTREILIRRT